jgi:hypothetical protein
MITIMGTVAGGFTSHPITVSTQGGDRILEEGTCSGSNNSCVEFASETFGKAVTFVSDGVNFWYVFDTF